MKKYLSFFFCRKMLMSAIMSRFKANCLEQIARLPQFFFVDSNTSCKDLFFQRGPNLTQKPLNLVDTDLEDPLRIISFSRTTSKGNCTHAVVFLNPQSFLGDICFALSTFRLQLKPKLLHLQIMGFSVP